jgi:hypothetical protein
MMIRIKGMKSMSMTINDLRLRSRRAFSWLLFVYTPSVTIETWTPRQGLHDEISSSVIAAIQDIALALTFAVLDLHYLIAWPLDQARGAPVAASGQTRAAGDHPRDGLGWSRGPAMSQTKQREISRAFAAPIRVEATPAGRIAPRRAY